jgi:subtilisin family serine protease
MDVVTHRYGCVVIFFCAISVGCGQDVESSFVQAADSCQPTAITNQFIVKWVDGSITVEQGTDREQFIRDFMTPQIDKIQYAEYDQRVQLPPRLRGPGARNSNPPNVADNWGDTDSNAAEAWSAGEIGAGVLVGVVDTGVDATQPQLTNQIAYNPGESGTDSQGRPKRNNGIDDEANGIIDDYAGYQFALKNGQGIDAAVHGTHVAGIIAAYHTDTIVQIGPVQGVAPGVKLIPSGFMDQNGGGSISNAILAINYAVARGARVINASWGGSFCSQTLRDSIANLYQQNIAFVSAAGNNANDIDIFQEFPASYNMPAQFTVGATDSTDLLATFSNFGVGDTHLFAPGVDITSTAPGGGMLTESGTSMSTPFVTGAVAIMMSVRPTATLAQIRQALYQSANYSPSYQNASHGRLNVGAAVDAIKQIVPL